MTTASKITVAGLRLLVSGCLLSSVVSCRAPSAGTGQYPVAGEMGERPFGMVQADRKDISAISEMANREMIRRQERIRAADEAALKANRYSAEGDNESAIRSFREALDRLPGNQ